eukprot:scaffold12417_cov131-Isochrysis_galbana.AAC.6
MTLTTDRMGCTSERGAYSRSGSLLHLAPANRERSRLEPEATLRSTRPHTTYVSTGDTRMSGSAASGLSHTRLSVGQ